MSLWKSSIRRSSDYEHRKEDDGNIENNIPSELYKIEPGQFVLYVSQDGFDQEIAIKINNLFTYLHHLEINARVNTIITDDKEYLIGNIACRSLTAVESPYEVAIGSWNTIAGLIGHYAGLTAKEVVEKLSSISERSSLSLNATELPDIVSIKSEDCATGGHWGCYENLDPFFTELKQVKPEPGSKEEKTLKTRMARKMEKVLRECAIFDIELDVDKIKKKVKDSLKSNVDYNLTLDIQTKKEGPLSFCTVCDIYVADEKDYKLDLTAVEKAIYLTFMLYKDGIKVTETHNSFRKLTQKIYNRLPDEDKCEKTAGGILDTGFVNPQVYANTLRGYISTIRDEVALKIAHPLVAQDFAIEGFKDKEFGIAMSSPELRAQIKKAFFK